MRKYAIWNKKDDIYTPSGRKFTAKEWLDNYSWASHPDAVPVIANGILNGAFIGELSQMKSMCESQGCVFSEGLTNEEILEVIESWEEREPEPAGPTAEERTAAALEAMADGQTTENAKALNALLGLEE